MRDGGATDSVRRVRVDDRWYGVVEVAASDIARADAKLLHLGLDVDDMVIFSAQLSAVSVSMGGRMPDDWIVPGSSCTWRPVE
jgi:hypothetical protein